MLGMLKKEVGLNKTTFLNLLSSIVLQGIAFFTIPIFTRVLGSEQFGLYSVFNSWAMILSIIFPLGLSNCISLGLYYFKTEYVSYKHSILMYNIIISCIFSSYDLIFPK